MSQISWFDIQQKTFTPEENALGLLEKSLDPWVSEDTFEVKIFIKDTISHYFMRRDLLPEQELVGEQHNGVTLALSGGTREPDPAAAVLLAAEHSNPGAPTG